MLRIFRGERRSDHVKPFAETEQSDGSGQADAPPTSTAAQRPESASAGESAPVEAAANGNGAQGMPDTPWETPAAAPRQDATPAAVPPQDTLPEQAPPQDAVPGEAPPPAEPGFLQRGRMRRRARFLRAARELAYRDLGGLVFDLHRFGARNDEVVVAKLETLRRIDEELRALEDALSERSPITVLREVGVAACPRCAAIHGSGDRFCPACGMPVAPSERPIGGAPAQPAASPAVHQNVPVAPPPVHAYQPPAPQPPAPAPITQPHSGGPPLPPIAPFPAQAQAPPPLPHAAAPAAAQQIGNGAYPALPAAPAAPAAPAGQDAHAAHAAPMGRPPAGDQLDDLQPDTAVHPTTAPDASARSEGPTQVLPGENERTRAFEPIPPATDERIVQGGDRTERSGE